jgi:hypothetical protein
MTITASHFGDSHRAVAILFDDSRGSSLVALDALIIAIGKDIHSGEIDLRSRASNGHNDQGGAKHNDHDHQAKDQKAYGSHSIFQLAHNSYSSIRCKRF